MRLCPVKSQPASQVPADLARFIGGNPDVEHPTGESAGSGQNRVERRRPHSIRKGTRGVRAVHGVKARPATATVTAPQCLAIGHGNTRVWGR